MNECHLAYASAEADCMIDMVNNEAKPVSKLPKLEPPTPKRVPETEQLGMPTDTTEELNNAQVIYEVASLRALLAARDETIALLKQKNLTLTIQLNQSNIHCCLFTLTFCSF